MLTSIFLLALAAAVYPPLLAVVVVILTRPNPKPLLWACYLGSLVVSISASIAIMAIFRSRGSIAGSSSHRLSPATYIAAGAIALAIAIAVMMLAGRGLIGRNMFRLGSAWTAQGEAVDGPHGGQGKNGDGTARRLSRGRLLGWRFARGARSLRSHCTRSPRTRPARSDRGRRDHRRVRADQVRADRGTDRELHDRSRRDGPPKCSDSQTGMQANKVTVVAVIAGLIGVGLIARGLSGIG